MLFKAKNRGKKAVAQYSFSSYILYLDVQQKCQHKSIIHMMQIDVLARWSFRIIIFSSRNDFELFSTCSKFSTIYPKTNLLLFIVCIYDFAVKKILS